MTPDFHQRLASIEAILAGMTASTAAPLSGPPAPWIEISADGDRAIGRGGLDIEYRGDSACPYGRSATRNRAPFEAVILHHTGVHHDIDWYVQYQIDGDPGRGGHHFGYHFYVSDTGQIIQGAPLSKRTNHVKGSGGSSRYPLGRHANNTNAIGVSCVGAGKPTFSPTPAQAAAALTLTRALCAALGVDSGHVYGHGEVQSDRHRTEGVSIAKEIRDGAAALGAPFVDDSDLDDEPIHAMWSPPSNVVEDDDDLDGEATLWPTPDAAGLALPVGGALASRATTLLQYTNQSAIRNRKCTSNLERRIVEAVEAVHGAGCSINIYSGGQDQKGVGPRRTGSIRHDDYGQGGRAADIHVFDPSGRQIKALELARVGQFWLASGFGGVGHEMRGGGIHVDEWTTPPPGGGLFWTYAYSDAMPWGAAVRRMLQQGANGVFP